jgi:predicted esterase YcpF (UPF0227 family)
MVPWAFSKREGVLMYPREKSILIGNILGGFAIERIGLCAGLASLRWIRIWLSG